MLLCYIQVYKTGLDCFHSFISLANLNGGWGQHISHNMNISIKCQSCFYAWYILIDYLPSVVVIMLIRLEYANVTKVNVKCLSHSFLSKLWISIYIASTSFLHCSNKWWAEVIKFYSCNKSFDNGEASGVIGSGNYLIRKWKFYSNKSLLQLIIAKMYFMRLVGKVLEN